MSASVIRAVHTASAQVLAVWRAMPGAYLLLGRASGGLPKSGSARPAREAGAPGIFRTFFWPLGPDQAVGFLTVVRLPSRRPAIEESDVILRGARGGDRDFTLQLAPICGEEEFGRQLASLAGSSAAPLARFLLDLMRPEAEVDVQRPVLLLQTFLHHAARHEGCVELLLEIPKNILVLQGWGPTTGSDVEIIVTGSSLARHPAEIGEFSRNDIQSPLTGSVLALPIELASSFSSAESIFLLTDTELFCRRILDCRVLDPASSAGQIRHLLPRLLCPSTLLAKLQKALLPRYEGADTLNSSARRVRAALDIAVVSQGTGVFLSGWLFDPLGQVDKVDFCGGDHIVRVDPDLVRIQREDVRLAFKNDLSFPTPVTSEIGFAVFVNVGGAPADNPHLRFTLNDGDIAFMPLKLRDAREPGIREQLCKGVDLYKPSGIPIVQQHLAPFLSCAELPEPIRSRIVLPGPLERPHALVVPMPTPALPRAIIAGLLRDPPTNEEQIIFVCGPDWSDRRVETLIELLRFYDLPATVIVLPARMGSIDGVLAAAECCQSETFLLLSPSASFAQDKSRQALREAMKDADAACPTVLYEDGSIRFAGSTELTFIERAPFTRVHSRWLGLSAQHVETQDPAIASGGTLDCCLLSRNALPAAEKARRFSTKIGQETALFSELRDRRSRVTWLPTIIVATAEEDDLNARGSAVELVDNWMVRASWGETTCAS